MYPFASHSFLTRRSMAAARLYLRLGTREASFYTFNGLNHFVQSFEGNVAVGSGEFIWFDDAEGLSTGVELPFEGNFSGHVSNSCVMLRERGSLCASSIDLS